MKQLNSKRNISTQYILKEDNKNKENVKKEDYKKVNYLINYLTFLLIIHRDHNQRHNAETTPRDHQRPPETTRDHQRPPETTRDRNPDTTRDYQRPPETTFSNKFIKIKGHKSFKKLAIFLSKP